MTQTYIYKPSKTAMQSGMAKTKKWALELKGEKKQYTDPLMGWTGSKDTAKQVKLFFDTKEEAIAYAEKNNFTYTLQEAEPLIVHPKSYGDNFKAVKP